MRKGVVDDNDKSLIELHSTSTVEMYPASSVSLDQGAEMTHVDWSEPQSLHRQATRSLSSVRRKQPPRCGDGLVGGDIPAMDEVLHAVKAENESLPSSHTQSQSELVAGGDGKSCLRKSSSLELNTIGNQITPAPTVDNPPLRIKGSLLPSLPFKPVLVNRYKSTVSTKPSVRGESAPAKSTTLTKPLATAAEVGVTVEASTMEIRKEKHEVSVKEQPSNEFRDRGAPEESLISRLSEDFKGAGEVAIQPLTSTSHASGELKSQRVSSISSTSCQVRGREMAGSPLTGQASGLISSREVISDSVTSPRSGGVRGDEVASRRSGGVRGDEVASPRSGGVRGDGVASHSITEHTVKVITDKVRQMDARYSQSKLFL